MEINFSNASEEEIKNFYKKISENVKYYREQKKMTQLEMALEIGIKSVAFYSNCEKLKNEKHFNLEHLYKISKALNIKVTDLINYP